MTDATANPAPPTQADQPDMAERLRGVIVRVRDDLEVTRHVFQGEPSYILRDPVSFSTQQLSTEDYALLVAIDAEQTLGETFDALVEAGTLDPADEQDYYNFVLGLHRSGLLNLPIGDHKALFARYERRRKAARMGRIMSPLFLRVPLWNPDAFLNRTVRSVGWIFGPIGLGIWGLLVAAAVAVAFVRRDELAAPLLTILELENLPLLWVILIGLKLFHEFGHAYACKAFGGQVPEMGAFFIMGTPCAYVDATAAWGFASLRKRMMVNLGGMYFESFFAAAGLMVWASTPPGLVNTAAYQVALMASIVTIGFNINPLAKFDGYYILSDCVGIPNLRQHASAEVGRFLSRVTLGIKPPPSGFGSTTRGGLLVFGLASAVYRTTVVIGLSAVLATKLFMVGLFVAVAFIGMTIFGIAMKLWRYLRHAPETEGVRLRAAVVCGGVVVAAVLIVGVIPLRTPVRLVGTVAAEHETAVFAPETARLDTLPVAAGETVSAGEVIASLSQTDLELAASDAEAAKRLARLEFDLAATADRAEAHRLAAMLEYHERAARTARGRVDRMTIEAPLDGRVIGLAADVHPGQLVYAGDPIARIGSGAWVVRLVVDEEALTDINPLPGDAVGLRSPIDPGRVLSGTITTVSPVGTRQITDDRVTQLAGGPITVDPATGEAGRPYFEILIRLHDHGGVVRPGATVHALIESAPQRLGTTLIRRVRRFAASLETNG